MSGDRGPQFWRGVLDRLDALLRDVDWNTVHEKYDGRNSSFAPIKDAKYGHLVQAVAPEFRDTDRTLYYGLRAQVDLTAIKLSDRLNLAWYGAAMYWKHWSGKPFQQALKPFGALTADQSLRFASNLRKVLHKVSSSPGRNEIAIRDLLVQLMKGEQFTLPGMGFGSCSLATRTTFLHLLYPDHIPIYDSMVMKAAGVTDPESPDIVLRLFPTLWELARAHTAHRAGKPPFERENAIRLLDMVLWEKGHEVNP